MGQWADFQILWTGKGWCTAPAGKTGCNAVESRMRQWIIGWRDKRIAVTRKKVISQVAPAVPKSAPKLAPKREKHPAAKQAAASLSTPVADGQYMQLCGTVRGSFTLSLFSRRGSQKTGEWMQCIANSAYLHRTPYTMSEPLSMSACIQEPLGFYIPRCLSFSDDWTGLFLVFFISKILIYGCFGVVVPTALPCTRAHCRSRSFAFPPTTGAVAWQHCGLQH